MIVCLKAHQSLDGTVRWFKSDDWYEINTHAPLLNATKMVIVVTVLLWNSIYWYVPFHMFSAQKIDSFSPCSMCQFFHSSIDWLHMCFIRVLFYLFVDMCGVFAGAWHFFFLLTISKYGWWNRSFSKQTDWTKR